MDMFENGKATTGSGYHLRSIPIDHSEMVARNLCFFHQHTVGWKRNKKSLGSDEGEGWSKFLLLQSTKALEHHWREEAIFPLFYKTISWIRAPDNQPTSSIPCISIEAWEVAKPLLWFSVACRGRSSFLSSFSMEMYGLEPLILFYKESVSVWRWIWLKLASAIYRSGWFLLLLPQRLRKRKAYLQCRPPDILVSKDDTVSLWNTSLVASPVQGFGLWAGREAQCWILKDSGSCSPAEALTAVLRLGLDGSGRGQSLSSEWVSELALLLHPSLLSFPLYRFQLGFFERGICFKREKKKKK